MRIMRAHVHRIRCAAAALAVISCAAIPASSQIDFSETVTFGDSLTHNDLLGWYYGNPQDMYGNDPHQAVFYKGGVSGDTLTSYAVAGSESSDVSVQIDLYDFLKTIFVQSKASLFGYEIGGNDILNNIGILAAYAPGQNASADAVIDDLIDNVRSQIMYLRSKHRNSEFIIWTIPDVTLTPDQWAYLNDVERANVRAHMQRVNDLIRGADRLPFVAVVDVYTELQNLIEYPPVLFDRPIIGPPAYGDYDHLFADTIHPTAVGNALLANGIIEKLNAKWGENIPLYTDEELADLAHIPH
ncbi:MAG: hypothetical protein D8M59_16520 [Planctomycetes bacterium]|nr:hypothetical protein [Planctomycetota bacterium]